MASYADHVQDELDDILRYGAAELFADAMAASKTKLETAATAGGMRLNCACNSYAGYMLLCHDACYSLSCRHASKRHLVFKMHT